MSAPLARVLAITFHPWRWLWATPEIEVIWQPQPVGRVAAIDGHRVILMDPRQSQAQRRCAITHEQIHIEHRHVGGCTPVERRRVCATTARRLIALDDLIAAYRWSRDLREIADERRIVTTPCRRINLPADATKLVEPLPVAKVQDLVDALWTPYRPMAALIVASGARSGEARGLTGDRVVSADVGARVRIDRQLVTRSSREPVWGR